MKYIIKNDVFLKEEDITEVVTRVKALIINSNNEILLGYSHDTYQFPGGHVEFKENLLVALNRELKEEVGVDLFINNLKPFACMFGYYKDHPSRDKNRKTEIYYFEIKKDIVPDLKNTKYTTNEKAGNFELRFIPLNIVREELEKNMSLSINFGGIDEEMLAVLDVYESNNVTI